MAKETSTVVKRILPYLTKIGYSVKDELFFEETIKTKSGTTWFTDIEIRPNPPGKLAFVIEAKRDTQKINAKHREQALLYGKARKVPFVVVTNGVAVELLNVHTGAHLSISGQGDVIPSKADLPSILAALKKNPAIDTIDIGESGTVFAPGVNLTELTNIFKRCHKAIRDIEKDDEHAFSDFSKFLFLKLLEEKADAEQSDSAGFRLDYKTRFPRLATQGEDEVKASIEAMFRAVQKNKVYGEVLADDAFYIQNPKTYAKIVEGLAHISLSDSDVDVKGTAFEYFLKFNLKGSQLGQYFTPREVVRLMIELSDLRSIVLGLVDPSNKYTVVDPSCGSGGFLVTGMQVLLGQAKSLLESGVLDKKAYSVVTRRIKQEVFYGCDAKHMLARTAKMNMIIAGDGFTNIRHGNSLTEEVDFLQISDGRTAPLVDVVLANPPFGMSESELGSHTMDLYDVPIAKGQALFLQKMIRITKPGGLICTVIDEGVLNTKSMTAIRQYILRTCNVEAVIHLPYVTFEPNYARVSTSVLLLRRKESDLRKQERPIFMYDLKEVGYSSTGKPEGTSSDEIVFELVRKYREFVHEHR